MIRTRNNLIKEHPNNESLCKDFTISALALYFINRKCCDSFHVIEVMKLQKNPVHANQKRIWHHILILVNLRMLNQNMGCHLL